MRKRETVKEDQMGCGNEEMNPKGFKKRKKMNELEDRATETFQTEAQRDKETKNK